MDRMDALTHLISQGDFSRAEEVLLEWNNTSSRLSLEDAIAQAERECGRLEKDLTATERSRGFQQGFLEGLKTARRLR